MNRGGGQKQPINLIKKYNTLEKATNQSTTVAAVLLSVGLVKVYVIQPPNARTASPRVVAVGTSLKDRLPGVDWGKNQRTLVLALSTHCHYCTESAPFFRRLRDEAGSGIQVVAVLPETVQEAQEYLTAEGLQVEVVKQVSLATIGVSGTPTMLLVNRGGTVTKLWKGKVQAKEEDSVLQVLRDRASVESKEKRNTKVTKTEQKGDLDYV
jgi:hypothetical protein